MGKAHGSGCGEVPVIALLYPIALCNWLCCCITNPIMQPVFPEGSICSTIAQAALEVIGNRWSLVVIRDMMFGNRRHFRELLENSMEGIASNILSARLKHLVDIGLLSRSDDPSHKQKVIYSLSESAIQLVPVMATIGAWGRRHRPATRELSIRAQLLEKGGPELWEEFMDELRVLHLGAPPKSEFSVLQQLTEAFQAAAEATKSELPSSDRDKIK
ncbi:DNA-binding HxlR family transcriptional regulator [Rhizobium mongolense]|uniref:DNA-binding HxlR family transcriptional regulator n=2 Tax=Rhizobium mongolense TaxID=57676 RepID=A0A7W6RKR0_9HYPH|nr:helix-turn-helix domain-containing protein [Rhizobium mongolense]MBB4274255.1 DNA-binding HxlR family transcriptional regulator [Rhizobium mongolense]